MKKTLLKVLSSTIALTLVATASVATASVKEIPVQEIKARPAAVETVKEEVRENSILAAVEAKIKEEKAAEVKEVKAAPVARLAAAEEAAAPVKAVKETAAPVAEAAVAPEVLEEAEPVAEWNISATEFDNVAMAFYAEPAAVNQVDARDNGLVVISGEGAMEDAVYRHFITIEKYLSAVKAMFEDYYGVEVDLVYDEEITDVIELDEGMRYYAHETGEELGVTEEMRQGLAPDTFLAYSPKTIVIEEGITNVSDYAFACCADVETIVLPSTIETIGDSAFEHCDSLESIVLPENAKIDETAFAYCDSLATIQLANADYYLNGGIATSADGENTNVRTMSAEEVNALVHYFS